MTRAMTAVAAACLVLAAAGANAEEVLGLKPVKVERPHKVVHRSVREQRRAAQIGLVTIDTAAGPVTVAPEFADAIRGFIADAVARGFKGRVKCFSLSPSHVANSLHYVGKACDFAQRGWNKTHRVMYRVRDLASKWGLRDGCSFRKPDCGHVDMGSRYAKAPVAPSILSIID